MSGADIALTVSGLVTLNFPARPGSYTSVAYANTEPGDEPATWLTMDSEGRVTAYAGKVEYGQGIRWGLAVEVADELHLAPEEIEVVLGDTDRVPWDMGTNGSRSTGGVGLELRKAAATARHALLERASAELDLPVEDLDLENGRIRSRADMGHSCSFAELLAAGALELELDDSVELNTPAQFTSIGASSPKLDALQRVTGKALYSRDITRPQMLFAAVLRKPSFGAELRDVDASLAERRPGVERIVIDGDLVAVLAESDEDAERALELVEATWDEAQSQTSSWDLAPTILAEPGETALIQEEGSLDDGFAAADNILEQTYFIPYVSTFPMEPRAAVAEWAGDRVTVWAGTQRPFGIRSELSQRLGIDESQVRVVAPEIGGGFGNKSFYRPAIEAAQLARLAEKPVRVARSRSEEMIWTRFRPAAIITVRSGFKDDGTLTAWEFRANHTSLDRPFVGQRGSPTPYEIPNIAVSVAAAPSPLSPGSYRSLGGAVNHFAREVHMDEIAVAVGIDPVEYRLRHLFHPRYRKVLEAAANSFGWPGPSGGGIALGEDVGSFTAACVELDVQDKEVRVKRVVSALDCGLTVNPESVKSQVEGSVVMGLGTALYEGIEFEGGRILNGSLARYRVPRITDSPGIDVELVGDPETPSTGAGEPAIVAVAPAIANAVFEQTGVRHRELPIQRFL